MSNKNCAVIGAGLGGLAAAIRIAKKGYHVTVFEKNKTPGGKASQIITNGFRFDTGPSLLTMPFVLQELFSAANENIEDHLDLRRLEIICKYFYSDGTVLNAYSNQTDFINEAVRKTKEKKENIEKFFSYSKIIYDLTADLFLFNPIWDLKNLLNGKYLKTLLHLKKIDTMRSMHAAITSFLNDDKMIRLFDRYATYSGSNPFDAPATLNIIAHVENGIGAYINNKGIYSITEALYNLALKVGVNFYFGANVNRILINDRKIVGVLVESQKLQFDIVVSNSDVNFTYTNLLNEQLSLHSDLIMKDQQSSSAIVFYWGVEGIHPELEIHNILFSDDYKKEFEEIFSLHQIPSDPTIYIYISSKFNKSDAPAGKENWFVMINAPYIVDSKYSAPIEALKLIILKKIKSTLSIDLSNKIKSETILTPAEIEIGTNSYKGSIYGVSSNSKFTAFVRQPNRSRKYKGLYFAGGSAHPGGGIPLVLLSAKITADLVSKYEN